MLNTQHIMQAHTVKGRLVCTMVVVGLVGIFALFAFGNPIVVQANNPPSANPFVSNTVTQPPLDNSGRDTSVMPGGTIYLWGEHSYDNDGIPGNAMLNYGWQCWNLDNPGAGNAFSSQQMNPSWTAPQVTRTNQFVCALTVGDGQLNSAPSNVTITVYATPYANIGADSTAIASGSSTYIRWCINNPSSPHPPFPGFPSACADATSCKVGTTPGASDFSNVCDASGGASTGPVSASRTYYLTATGPGGSATDQVTVTVSAVATPTLSLIGSSTCPAGSTGQTRLSWTVTPAGSYEYRVFDDGILRGSYVSPVDLAPLGNAGSSHSYVVQAFDSSSGVPLATSNTVSVTPNSSCGQAGVPVGAPVASISGSCPSLSVSWTPASAPFTSFELKACQGEGCDPRNSAPFTTQSASPFVHTDTFYAVNGALRFTVRSLNSQNNQVSGYSNIVESRNYCSGAPVNPRDFTMNSVVDSCTDVTTTWSQSWLNAESSYLVQRVVPSAAFPPRPGDQVFTCFPRGSSVFSNRSYTDTGLAPDTMYRYSVMAFVDNVCLAGGYQATPSFVDVRTPTCSSAQPPTANLTIRKLGTGAWGQSVNITAGEEVELRWSSSNATRCTGDASFSTGPSSPTSGIQQTVTEPPSGLLTYTVRCYNGPDPFAPSSTDTASVTVNAAGSPDISADLLIVDYGASSTVTWTLNGNAGCTVTAPNNDPLTGPKGGNGSATTVSLVGETTYTLTCTNGVGAGDDRSDSVTIKVRPMFEEF